jgi:hypothetical protein
MRTPKQVQYLVLEATCANVSIREWDKLYENTTRANKASINRLVKKHLPELFEDLSLDLRNPYEYYKSSTHLILVHSATDYFIRYDTSFNN